MPYPSQEDALRGSPVYHWIDDHFLRPDPFAFKEVSFRPVVSMISEELDIDPNGIFCIGSGAIGLSFNPRKIQNQKLKLFDDHSDLDLAVISEVYFEKAWRDLRKASQPTLESIDARVRRNIEWQKKRFFDGAIVANKLLSSLSFGPEWLAARVRIGQHIARALGREVSFQFWIYRDYWSLRNYVAEGIVKCRKFLV